MYPQIPPPPRPAFPTPCHVIPPKVENELEDLIDELLERDGAAGNSTIIGESPPCAKT